MDRRSMFAVAVAGTLALAVAAAWFTGVPLALAQGQRPPAAVSKPAAPPTKPRTHSHDHDHPPVPAAYANVAVPVRVWTDRQMIARGKEIYAAKCAVCHGKRGDGQGPAAPNLRPKPADFTDAHMVAEMSGAYWVWRVSEGGLVEPFKSKGSAMPAWKDELSIEDRWAVIAYSHTFSGHRGPHVASEHPELGPKPKFVNGQGTVIALRPDRQQIIVEHGEITGFMEAMTMGYEVSPPSLLEKVKPGDRVRFTIDTEARVITTLEPQKD